MTTTPTIDTGKNSLKRESKFGISTALVTAVAVNAALALLTGVDQSQWSGWWAPVLSAGVAGAVGLLTAYKTRNRVQ